MISNFLMYAHIEAVKKDHGHNKFGLPWLSEQKYFDSKYIDTDIEK